MAEVTTKLQDAIAKQVPILTTELFLNVMLTWRKQKPAVPDPRLGCVCFGCDKRLIHITLEDHYNEIRTGFGWLWSNNLLCTTVQDLDRATSILHGHLAFLRAAGIQVDRMVYCVDEQRLLCQDCLENHLRQIYKLLGVPYVEQGDREASVDVSCVTGTQATEDHVPVDPASGTDGRTGG